MLQPSPLRGSGCNTLSHSSLANVYIRKRMFYPLIKCTLNGYIRCNLSAEFQRGLGWSKPLLSLMSKYCLMILLITLTYVTLSDLYNLITTSRSISLYHRSQFKIPRQCKISNSCEFFHNFSSNFQTTFLLFDIVTHVTHCFRLTPQHRECKHPLFDAA